MISTRALTCIGTRLAFSGPMLTEVRERIVNILVAALDSPVTMIQSTAVATAFEARLFDDPFVRSKVDALTQSPYPKSPTWPG